MDGYGTFGAAGATITGLDGGSSPTFQVRAVSSKGAVSAWVPVTSGTVVTRPAVPTVTVTSGPQVDCVSIGVEAGPDGGARVLETQYRLNLTDPWVTVDARHPIPTSWCAPGTPDPVPVTLEVRRRNAAGTAAWSTGTGAATTQPPGVPAATTIALSAAGDGVVWSAPAADRPITGYEYEVTWDGGATFAAPAPVPGGAAATVLRFDDVSLAGTFGVAVRALDVKGAGEWSDVVAVTR